MILFELSKIEIFLLILIITYIHAFIKAYSDNCVKAFLVSFEAYFH